jgi:serine/threonine protein kinase
MNKFGYQKPTLRQLAVGDPVWLADVPYTISRITSGGMGSVFLLDKVSDSGKLNFMLYRLRMAVKTVLPDQVDAASRALFNRELTVWSGFAHPNIVALHEILDAGDDGWVATMHWCAGSVADLLQSRGKLSTYHASWVVFNVLRGLKHAYDEHKVLHLDIKPANILYERGLEDYIPPEVGRQSDYSEFRNHCYQVSDWGIASIREPQLQRIAGLHATHLLPAQTLNNWGTELYMAPERFTPGTKSTIASDVFSVGMMYLQLVCGRLPLPEDIYPRANLISGSYYGFAKQLLAESGTSSAFKNVVLRMLDRNPNSRYLNYDELIKDTSKLLTSGMPLKNRIFGF